MLLISKTKGKSQEQAIKHFNEKNEIFLSSADIRQLDNNDLSELRKDWKGLNYGVTSTQIDYKKKTITHHTLSNQKKPTVIKLKTIPDFTGKYLKDVLELKGGVQFIGAIFGISKPTKSKIINELERISGKPSDRIYFYSPDNSSRDSYPIRAVVLCFYDGGFGVNCFRLPGVHVNWYV